MSSIASQFAQQLARGAVHQTSPTQPFTWASGWLSPFYCDNRKTLAYPKVRTFVKDQLAAMIRAQYPELLPLLVSPLVLSLKVLW